MPLRHQTQIAGASQNDAAECSYRVLLTLVLVIKVPIAKNIKTKVLYPKDSIYLHFDILVRELIDAFEGGMQMDIVWIRI